MRPSEALRTIPNNKNNIYDRSNLGKEKDQIFKL